jgi:hypothetical protein
VRKIPTLFQRDPENPRHVIPEVVPGCEWVLRGRGIPTRKYDGTCVMFDAAGQWWARREVRTGRPVPPYYTVVQVDETTGKTVGWEPIDQSSFVKWHTEALTNALDYGVELPVGTYELCGPKINRNPEKFETHMLIRHGATVLEPPPSATVAGTLTFNLVRKWVLSMPYEGIVWHHPNRAYMAKIKRRDFE